MEEETRIEAEYSPLHCKVRLFGLVRPKFKNATNSEELVVLTTTRRWKEEDTPFDPFLELEEEEAQYLLESLWNAGVRSPQITSTLGEINATKNHLKDMQRLVFDERRK